jgi:hypothetical protein
MKNLITSLGLLFLLQSFHVSAQVVCLKFEEYVNENGEILPVDLQSLIGQTVEISNRSIYINDNLYSTIHVYDRYFSKRLSLNAIISEFSNISDLSNDNIHGSIKVFNNLHAGSFYHSQYFKFIKIQDLENLKYYVQVNDFLFKMSECKGYKPCLAEGMRFTEYDSDSISFITKLPRYRSKVIPAKFETKREHVFYGQTYTQEITQASLEKSSINLSGNQKNICPNISVVYDTVYRDFVVSEAYTELELIPKEYETVSEYVLSKEGYNKVTDFIPHKYEYIDKCLIKSKSMEQQIKISSSTDCSNQIFLSCITYNFSQNESEKGIFKIEQTKACPEGYESRPSGCYKLDFIGPIYVRRAYKKLAKPDKVESKINPVKYIKRPVQIIQNIEEIPERCIETETIEWSYLKNVKDASSKRVPDYNYKYPNPTVSWIKNVRPLEINEEIKEEGRTIHLDPRNKIYCDSHRMETVEVVCEKFITDDLIARITDKLRKSGYEIPEENNEQEYYEALTDFQKENNLVIGVLSRETLEFMRVEY